ncbi:MAG: O-antigen ligase family protein, partial [Acidobacteria bacterium]|nr:O-antigen ligase family protein [Acidobacteriota bacterium]
SRAVTDRPYSQVVIGIALTALIGFAPQNPATGDPVGILVNRTLLLLIVVLCFVSFGNSATPDFSRPFYAGLAVMLGVMFLSLIASNGSISEGRERWYETFLLTVFFVALARFNHRQSIAWKASVLVMVILVTLAYFGAALIRNQDGAFRGPFINPNYFASFLLVGFTGSLSILAFIPNWRFRAMAAAAAAFLLYGITATTSRGATLAALSVIIVACWKIRGRFFRGGLLLLLVIILTNSNLLVKFFDFGQIDPRNYLRPYIWQSALQMISAHPWLGVGPGQYGYVAGRFNFPTENGVARYMYYPDVAHSEYLQRAAEIGIPGALLMGGLTLYILWLLARQRRESGGHSKFLCEAGFLSALGAGIHALVDNNWTLPVASCVLLVVSLGSLPPDKPLFQWTRARAVIAGLAVLLFYLLSTAVPALAFYFNEVGRAALRQDDVLRAEVAFKTASAILPDHAIFKDNLGGAYYRAYGRSKDEEFLKRAQEQFFQAAAINPNDHQILKHLETSFVEELSRDRGRTPGIHLQILELDRKILELEPFNPFARRNLAEALFSLGRRSEALEQLSKAIEIEPNYIPAHRKLADWYREAGDMTRSDLHNKQADALEARYAVFKPSAQYEAMLLGRSLDNTQ